MHEEAKIIIVSKNGIHLVINTMLRFHNYFQLQRCGCIILRSLAYDQNENIETIKNLGGNN
jgi:hypothetical protein